MKILPEKLVHEVDHRIPTYFVSLNGKTKFNTVCYIFFESAASHATHSRFGYDDMVQANIYWVLSRLHVKMISYPKMGQKVKVRTWPKGIDKLFFLRDYELLDEEGVLLATATTAWLVLDGNTGRPKRLEDIDDLHYYSVEGLHAIEATPEKLPEIQDPDEHFKHIARYSDLDINNHVNAGRYIEWLQDMYPIELYKEQNIKEFQINYQSETRHGEEVDIHLQKSKKLGGFDFTEGIKSQDHSTAFRAKIQFGKFL